MHPDVFGDVFEHHRTQTLNAFIQEFLLALDYRLADAIDRLAAMLDVFEQIDRRAETLFDVIARFLGRFFIVEHLAVGLVDAQVRDAVVFKANDVAVADLFNRYFRNNRLRFWAAVRCWVGASRDGACTNPASIADCARLSRSGSRWK